MSKLVDDVKSGLKGIRGAGDALRGEVLSATDQAFDTDPNHPKTLGKETDNKIIAEKGKQDMKGVDNMLARREWEHKGVEPPAHVGHRESERPNEGLNREPGTILPGETTTYGNGSTEDDAVREAGAHVPGEQRLA
ncbi:hypothetical protein SNK04_005886 [Fusarium graminearum]